MSTMQVFYNRLFSANRADDPELAGLAKLARATQKQLRALNLDWVMW